MRGLLVAVVLMLASGARADIYIWKDSRGIAHYTNKEYEIPARYKARAKPLNIEAAPAGPSTTVPQQPVAPSPLPAQPQDKPANVLAAPPTPAAQTVVAPAAQNVSAQPRKKHRIRSGSE